MYVDGHSDSFRVNILEVENRQLHERTMKLSNQVSSLERALRNTETFYSLEVQTYFCVATLLLLES